MMNRLCSTLHNGIDFSKRIPEEEGLKLSKGGAVTQIKENKKIPLDHLHFSFYQLNLFTPHYSFPLNNEFLARATIVSNTQICLENAWREVTILLLKHFLPDQHKQILQVQKQVVSYREQITELQRQFENYMINTDQDTLHDIEKYSALKNSIEDIRVAKDQLQNYEKVHEELMHEHPLLVSYSTVITLVRFFSSPLTKNRCSSLSSDCRNLQKSLPTLGEFS